MIRAELFELYIKALEVARSLGSRETKCPSCKEDTEIAALFQPGECSHLCCEACVMTGEDFSMCSKCWEKQAPIILERRK